MPRKEPTFVDVLRDLAAHYDRPIDESELCAQVLARRPSQARDPRAAVRSALRSSSPRHGWLRLGDGTAVPVRVALQGVRFRVVPEADEIAAGVLRAEVLEPFVSPHSTLTIEQTDSVPQTISLRTLPTRLRGNLDPRGYDLRRWYERCGFAPGDSILVTIFDIQTGRLAFEHELLATLRVPECTARDRDLADAIYARLRTARTIPLFSDQIILPVAYAAGWRATYPGSPWRDVVDADPRLILINDAIGLSAVGLGLNKTYDEQSWRDEEDRLLQEIDSLQDEVRRSREIDLQARLWDGALTRASVEAAMLDEAEDEFAFPLIDDFYDPEDLLNDADDWMIDTLNDDTEPMMMAEDPRIEEATRQLFAVLSDDELELLQSANAAETELFLASKLNELLVRAPALFVPLEPGAAIGLYDPSDVGVAGFEWLVSDSEFEDDDDEFDNALDLALTRSFELMNNFYDWIIASGRSVQTAASRTNGMRVYANFLAYYYNRSLDQGDYATLDECLFFFLPRKIVHSSPRMARELCTSVKQFYNFLRQEALINDDAFAQAIWRRRTQAGRLIELYDRISSDSPNFELLFRRLFMPYL